MQTRRGFLAAMAAMVPAWLTGRKVEAATEQPKCEVVTATRVYLPVLTLPNQRNIVAIQVGDKVTVKHDEYPGTTHLLGKVVEVAFVYPDGEIDVEHEGVVYMTASHQVTPQ